MKKFLLFVIFLLIPFIGVMADTYTGDEPLYGAIVENDLHRIYEELTELGDIDYAVEICEYEPLLREYLIANLSMTALNMMISAYNGEVPVELVIDQVVQLVTLINKLYVLRPEARDLGDL